MKVVDKRGLWMTNFSQFRMHDPMSDTYFEPGEPTKAADTAWRQNNKAVVMLTDDDGVIVDDPALTEVPVDEPVAVDTAKGKVK